jgi:NAD(P)H dehydrogenase (quinone)
MPGRPSDAADLPATPPPEAVAPLADKELHVPKVIVLFDSKSGNTRAAAENIAEGVGLVPGAEAALMDAVALDVDTIADADAVAIGSPNYYTYMSGRIKTFFDLAFRNPAFKGKPFAAFSTHGGGGGIAEGIEKLAGSIGMNKISDGLDFLGAPAGDQLKTCRHMGQVLGRAATNA